MAALPANRIVVSGELPEAASAHAEKLGSFAERAERVAGRPSYTREGFVMEGEGKSYAMWFHNFRHWFVGPREAIEQEGVAQAERPWRRCDQVRRREGAGRSQGRGRYLN